MQPIRITLPVTPEQAKAVIAAGPGAVVCHPLAMGRRRGELSRALGKAGVPHRLVRTLGWSAKGPAVAIAKPKPADQSAALTMGSQTARPLRPKRQADAGE